MNKHPLIKSHIRRFFKADPGWWNNAYPRLWIGKALWWFLKSGIANDSDFLNHTHCKGCEVVYYCFEKDPKYYPERVVGENLCLRCKEEIENEKGQTPTKIL